MNKFFNFLSIAKKSGNLLEGYSKCDDYRNKTSVRIQAMKTISQIGTSEQKLEFIKPMINCENSKISEAAEELIGD